MSGKSSLSKENNLKTKLAYISYGIDCMDHPPVDLLENWEHIKKVLIVAKNIAYEGISYRQLKRLRIAIEALDNE